MVRGGEDESVLPPDDSPPLSDDADSAAKARSRADRTELAQGMDNNGSTRVTAPGRTLRCRWSTYSPRAHALSGSDADGARGSPGRRRQAGVAPISGV